MLIQFPILIALYFSVREVAVAENSYMLYEFQQNFDFGTIQTMFLGILELAEREQIFLPITIGILQFAQMKLTFSLKKSKTPEPKEKKKDGMPDMSSMNKSMTYAMPLMIAFFTASLPAGVGLYWGTSTLFGIGQTIAINREKPEDKKNKSNNSSEVTVKVVEKNEKEKYLPKAKSKKKK
jgi:YidC/Oxa1 family membrane protein insertase